MRVASPRKVSGAFAVNYIRISGMAALQDQVSDQWIAGFNGCETRERSGTPGCGEEKTHCELEGDDGPNTAKIYRRAMNSLEEALFPNVPEPGFLGKN
jgi:hypothetical protein